MEIEMRDELSLTVDRLAAAAEMLERTMLQLAERQSAFAVSAEASLERMVATAEPGREAELERKLAEAEQKIAELTAAAATVPVTVTQGRKTLPAGMATMLAKQGVTVESMEAGALDAALVSLSIEQRMAVKAQMMRAGLL